MITASYMEGGVMAEWAAILAVVGKSLTPRIPGHIEPSKAPYDRAMRLVRHVDKIAEKLEEMEKPARIDLARIAALYVSISLSKDKKEEVADDASELATDQLKNLVPEEDLELVLKIIREQRKRDARLPESRLLADAIALEDVGLVGLWNASGKYHALGRSLEQFIRLWKTQGEYGYWETRLRDGFYNEVARVLCRKRLADVGAVIGQMEEQQNAADIT